MVGGCRRCGSVGRAARADRSRRWSWVGCVTPQVPTPSPYYFALRPVRCFTTGVTKALRRHPAPDSLSRSVQYKPALSRTVPYRTAVLSPLSRPHRRPHRHPHSLPLPPRPHCLPYCLPHCHPHSRHPPTCLARPARINRLLVRHTVGPDEPPSTDQLQRQLDAAAEKHVLYAKKRRRGEGKQRWAGAGATRVKSKCTGPRWRRGGDAGAGTGTRRQRG